MNLHQLQEQLKDRAFFEKAVSPMQISVLLAQLFLAFAVTFAVLFLAPLLWRFVTDGLNAPGAYTTIFNAKMGGGSALLFFILAVICQITAKVNRNKIYTKAHQAYLENPIVYVLTAVLRRGDVTLYAYAHPPAHQKAVEELLTSTLAYASKAYNMANAHISAVRMKHKAIKMLALKKKLIAEIPALGAYQFSLNSHTQPIAKGNQLYYLYLTSGLPRSHENYLQLTLDNVNMADFTECG